MSSNWSDRSWFNSTGNWRVDKPSKQEFNELKRIGLLEVAYAGIPTNYRKYKKVLKSVK